MRITPEQLIRLKDFVPAFETAAHLMHGLSDEEEQAFKNDAESLKALIQDIRNNV